TSTHLWRGSKKRNTNASACWSNSKTLLMLMDLSLWCGERVAVKILTARRQSPPCPPTRHAKLARRARSPRRTPTYIASKLASVSATSLLICVANLKKTKRRSHACVKPASSAPT
ncbi:hypothetical protein GGI24_001024, partial [Coemansia furcata]